jgi:O-antigen/teichoic acid export membrane protein
VIGLAISYFQAKREVWKLRRMVLPCIATAAGACLCVFLTHRVLASLVVMAGGEIYVAGALFALVSGNGARFEMQGVRQDLRSVTVTCLPVAALGIVVGLYTRVDTLVLAAYSFPALAAYTIAQRLFQPFQIAATSFGAVIYTHAAIASSQQLRYARKFLLKELPPIIGISAVLAVGLYFGG